VFLKSSAVDALMWKCFEREATLRLVASCIVEACRIARRFHAFGWCSQLYVHYTVGLPLLGSSWQNFICAYIYLCLRLFVPKFICAYIYLCLRLFVPTFICAYVYLCLRLFVPTFICAYVYLFLHLFVPTFICAYIYLCLHLFVPTFICSYIYLCLHLFVPIFSI
jgi:hypothetical protein